MLTISSIAVAPMPQTTPPVARVQPVMPVRPSNAVARDAAGANAAPQGEGAQVQAQAAPSPLAPVAPPQEGQRAEGLPNAAAPERSGLPPPTAGEGARGAMARAAPATVGVGLSAVEQGSPTAGTAEARPATQAEAGPTDPAAREAGRDAQTATGDGGPADPAARREVAQQGNQVAQQAQAQRDAPPVAVKNPALEALETQIKELLPNMWKASRAAVDMMIGEEAREAAQERAKRLEELQARLLAKPLAALPPEEPAQTYSAVAQGERPTTTGTRVDRLA